MFEKSYNPSEVSSFHNKLSRNGSGSDCEETKMSQDPKEPLIMEQPQDNSLKLTLLKPLEQP